MGSTPQERIGFKSIFDLYTAWVRRLFFTEYCHFGADVRWVIGVFSAYRLKPTEQRCLLAKSGGKWYYINKEERL